MNWFFSSGDNPFFYPGQLNKLSFIPDTWNGFGYGQSLIPRLWIDYPFHFITALLARLGFSWFFIDKLWWLVVLLLACFSMYRLSLYLFRNKLIAIGSVLFFVLNTYFLLIFDGGQLGIALAIALSPLVLLQGYLFFVRKKITYTILFGFVYSLLLAFDLRICFAITLLLIFLTIYLAVRRLLQPKLHWILFPTMVICIHAYWLLPLVLYPTQLNSYKTFTSAGDGLAFFSVADFTHSLSLLHPNWPTNLFGKVSFFRSEFLLITILAFSGLLLKKRRIILLLLLVAIVGAFLAKGVHEPFGNIYTLLFDIIPGFSLFRDPTKWYIYILLSYSLVIPYVCYRLWKKYYFFLFIPFLIVLLLPVFQRQSKGNIQPIAINKESQQVYEYLRAARPGRVLWLPRNDAYANIDDLHPLLIATDLFQQSSPSGIIEELKKSETNETLARAGVSYIIVPPDDKKVLFLKEYRYAQDERDVLTKGLAILPFEKISNFRNYQIYKLSYTHELITSSLGNIELEETGTNQYNLAVQPVPQSIIVRWNYSPYWEILSKDRVYKPTITEDGFMEFELNNNTSSTVILRYKPQSVVIMGSLISIVSVVLFSCLYFIKRKT